MCWTHITTDCSCLSTEKEIDFKYDIVSSTETALAQDVSVGVSIEDNSQNDSNGERNVPVLVENFGRFVSQHHAHGNKRFIENFEVICKILLVCTLTNFFS